ncbi:leucine-rich repeat and coiled-coil domain-containing protein 1-like [Periplaneta americana]|uniref:leucine-rich repeat and coiled-coil domain-containing protein 1-like n=1 Tax=Periplaneta americana TaxID=6978 RepID=UPI0037E9BEAC
MSKQISELENQMMTLRQSIETHNQIKEELTHKASEYENENKHYEIRNEALARELHVCRCALDTEKDKLRVKNTIIDDQNATIKQLKNTLKEKSDEFKQISKDYEQMEKDLCAEKLSKQKLITKMNQLQWHKEQLEDQIVELEDELKLAESGDEKHQQMLLDLEKQVDNKQREWAFQLKLLTKEKEQAVNAARFATHKLSETTSEFQKQVATQKKVQRMLTSLLSDKEAMLKTASQRITTLNTYFEKNLKWRQCFQQQFETKLLQAHDAVSEVIYDVSRGNTVV